MAEDDEDVGASPSDRAEDRAEELMRAAPKPQQRRTQQQEGSTGGAQSRNHSPSPWDGLE